jgi:magnesium-transporting ATPase (P-type)
MSAGFTQGIGLYVLGWSSLALFLVTLLHLYEIKNKTDIFSQLKNSSIFSKKIIWSTTVLVLCILTFFLINQFYNKKSWNTQNLTPVLNQNMVKMGSALRNEQYLEFLKYNHPLMIQSIGGQNKMIELLQNTMSGYQH